MEQGKKVSIELTVEELNTVLGGLAELPYKMSGALIQNVVNQYQQQNPQNVSDVEAK